MLGAPTVRAQAAQPVVSFRNELPGSFRLERVRVWVDGTLSYDQARTFELQLAPGAHVVALEADYRMHDPVFTYLDGYRLALRSQHTVPANTIRVVARAVESGGVTTPIERREQIIWR